MSKLEQQHRGFERVFERLRAENPNASWDELTALFNDAIRHEPDLVDGAVEAWLERTRRPDRRRG
jgi:hypothetical protein